ncbi:Signal transduction histidine kinase [Lachnospiraceae bacterium]|nr:Signal transduction histidine kinase [Lachnospiraceae bacterium]
MNEYKNLRAFLIKRFLLTIAFVGINEYAVLYIVNRTFIPVVMSLFFHGESVEEVGIAGIIFAIISILVTLILELVKFLVPDGMKLTVNTLINALKSSVGTKILGSPKEFAKLNASQEVLLSVFFIAILIIILIPYAIGAYYFARKIIVEVKKIEEEDLAKQKEYEKSRNLMLSDIAHDLRTPITTVSGYAKALEDGMVSDDKKPEYLAAIQRKSARLTDLINLLFDYVRLDSEGFTLTKEDFDICELCRETAAFMYQDIEDAGMELEVDIPEKIKKINGDKLQVSRVITNLLTNAIRHNKTGTSIGLFLIIEDDETIRIMVADNGEKIDEEYAKTIFEPFVVGDESRSTKGGTGLGLSIVKKVLDMHEWKIRLVQQPHTRKYPVAAEYSKMFMITI